MVSLLSFVACNPIDDRDSMTGSITADQIKASVTVEQIAGKNVNKISFECSSPINCQWTNGVVTKAGANGDMLMFTTGKQTVTLTGICGDGSIIKKEFSVNVDDMHYPVPVEYSLFCGTGEKTWTWDDEVAGWGKGAYRSDFNPTWWAVSIDNIEEQAAKYGHAGEGKGATMKFVLNGLKIIKSTGSQGTFSFDMTKTTFNPDDKTIWACGKLYTKNSAILFPSIADDWVDTNTFDILKLNADKLYLSAPLAGSTKPWNAATFWCFKAVK